jgi:hypothetical protein
VSGIEDVNRFNEEFNLVKNRSKVAKRALFFEGRTWRRWS